MKRLLLILLAIFTALGAGAQCVASLNSSAAPTGNHLLRVNFNNTSTYGTPFAGQYKEWRITFGDGTYQSGLSSNGTLHDYPSPGTYTVGIRIHNMDSLTMTSYCTDSATITVTVAYPPCGTIVNIGSSTPPAYSFTASNPASASGISYAWNFGDGTSGTGATPSHTYTTSGSYTITCTSTVGSCTYVNTLNLYVLAPGASLNCSSLHASFTAAVGGGGSNVGVSNSSNVVSAFPYNTGVTWYYGDGTTSNYFSPPAHSYAATGTYNIKLVVHWHDSLNTTSCKDSVTHSVTISSIAPASLSGYIFWDTITYTGARAFKVWLIQFDPATNMLSAVDSQTTASSYYPSYSFTGKAPGNYLVKAAPVGGPGSGTGLIPTYSFSSSNWSSASTLVAPAGGTAYGSIYVLAGTVTSGPGFIGGNVALGANKGASGGVPGRIVLLRNTAGKDMQMSTTDANGNFSFSNVANGTYSVYPELINYSTIPAVVTVSNGSSSITGIAFHQDDVKMSIAPHGLSVGNAPSSPGLWTMSPNPASSTLNITWSSLAQQVVTITIMDMAGKTVLQHTFAAQTSGTSTIDITSLQPGLYFVRGNAAHGASLQKLVVQ